MYDITCVTKSTGGHMGVKHTCTGCHEAFDRNEQFEIAEVGEHNEDRVYIINVHRNPDCRELAVRNVTQ